MTMPVAAKSLSAARATARPAAQQRCLVVAAASSQKPSPVQTAITSLRYLWHVSDRDWCRDTSLHRGSVSNWRKKQYSTCVQFLQKSSRGPAWYSKELQWSATVIQWTPLGAGRMDQWAATGSGQHNIT